MIVIDCTVKRSFFSLFFCGVIWDKLSFFGYCKVTTEVPSALLHSDKNLLIF